MAEKVAKRALRDQTRGARAQSPVEPGRRERNKQEKRARIIAAAKELFGSKGFADTTTQEIAERADIGTGTLFLYAKSKEELLVMVFSGDMLKEVQTAFSHLPASGSLVDKLMHAFGSMIEHHDQDRDLAKALLKEVSVLSIPGPSKDLALLMRSIFAGIGDILLSGEGGEKLREGVDPLLAAENLFGIYYLSLLNWISGNLSKPRFLKRLRAKLTLGVEGLIDPARAAEPTPARKPARKS
ncbi:MAG: TetR/AcrR family transcriptional regulator [Parvibaculum sp.]